MEKDLQLNHHHPLDPGGIHLYNLYIPLHTSISRGVIFHLGTGGSTVELFWGPPKAGLQKSRDCTDPSRIRNPSLMSGKPCLRFPRKKTRPGQPCVVLSAGFHAADAAASVGGCSGGLESLRRAPCPRARSQRLAPFGAGRWSWGPQVGSE